MGGGAGRGACAEVREVQPRSEDSAEVETSEGDFLATAALALCSPLSLELHCVSE